jgi:hypothetical protein
MTGATTHASLFAAAGIAPDPHHCTIDGQEYRAQVVEDGGRLRIRVQARIGGKWEAVLFRARARDVIRSSGLAEWEGGERGAWRLADGRVVYELTEVPAPASRSERQVGLDIVSDLSRERRRAAYLAHLRDYALELYNRRVASMGDEAAVTPDDVRRYFEHEMRPPPPPPEELSRNFLAGVFRGRAWREVGRTISKTPGSHGNEIRKYVPTTGAAQR